MPFHLQQANGMLLDFSRRAEIAALPANGKIHAVC